MKQCFDKEFISFPYFEEAKGISSIFRSSDDLYNLTYKLKIRVLPKNKKMFINFVKLFAINLAGKNGRMKVKLDKNNFYEKGEYKDFAKYEWMIALIDFLEKKNALLVNKGVCGERYTILTLTSNFFNYFPKRLLEYYREVFQLSNIIGYTGKDEEIKAKELYEYSFFVNRNSFTISGVDAPYKMDLIGFKRVFSGEEGGRIYSYGCGGGFQRYSKSQRENIYINYEPTVEIDFNCLHLNLLYNLKDVQMNLEDAYSISGVSEIYRPILKALVLILINGKSDDKKIFNTLNKYFLDKKNKEIRNLYFDLFLKEFNSIEKRMKILEKMKNKHYIIKDYFCSGIGMKLQRIDSDIMTDILQVCMKRKIIALPVHDSVIVPVSSSREVKTIMTQCYKTKMGFEIKVN